MDALARQRRAVVAVWKADVTTRPAGASQDLDGLALHATGIPVAHWNGAHLTDEGGVARLPEAAAWFAERALPWGVLVPSELDVDPGTPRITEQAVMLRHLDNLEDLDPRLVLRWDDATGAAGVQAEAFGDPLEDATAFVTPKLVNPACAVVVAYDGAAPVATATLVSVDGVAAVFGVGTVSGARRQGLGRAVTLAVLHEGRRRGCDLAYLNPSPSGHGVYAGLGFEDAPPWRVYSALPVPDTAV